MESKTPSAKLQRRSIVIAGFGQNMVLTFVSTFMLMYLTQYARISKEGLIIRDGHPRGSKGVRTRSTTRLWACSSIKHARAGVKLRPYILFSALPVAFFSAILFCIPNFSETGKLIFFAVNLVLLGFGLYRLRRAVLGIDRCRVRRSRADEGNLLRPRVRLHRAWHCDARRAVACEVF